MLRSLPTSRSDCFFPRFWYQATQNGKSIPGRAGRQEIGYGVLRAARARKKHDWPFRYSSFLYMSVLPRSWFSDVFLLQDQSEWLFRACGFLRKPEGVGVGYERVVIIVSVRFVRCAAFRVAPHTVFQDRVPDKPSPGATGCGILADPRRIDCPRKSCSLLHLASLELRPGK
jgi:hypothetical protein